MLVGEYIYWPMGAASVPLSLCAAQHPEPTQQSHQQRSGVVHTAERLALPLASERYGTPLRREHGQRSISTPPSAL